VTYTCYTCACACAHEHIRKCLTVDLPPQPAPFLSVAARPKRGGLALVAQGRVRGHCSRWRWHPRPHGIEANGCPDARVGDTTAACRCCRLAGGGSAGESGQCGGSRGADLDGRLCFVCLLHIGSRQSVSVAGGLLQGHRVPQGAPGD
jgi:hypothetical protein